MQDFENSNFCLLSCDDTLPGFAKFVVRFMIQMSKVTLCLDLLKRIRIARCTFNTINVMFQDFAVRTLEMTETTTGAEAENSIEVTIYYTI